MRHVRGFERPAVQWIFVALAVILIALVAAEAVVVRRQRTAMEQLRIESLNARLARQEIEMRFAHERSAREALSLEIARLRGMPPPPATVPPTLTLQPLTSRGPTPPAPSVARPRADAVIDLQLMLPRAAKAGATTCTVTMRTWSTGQTVWTRGGLPVSAIDGRPAVVARLAGDVLATGSYEILLTGTGPGGQSIDIAAYEVTVGELSASIGSMASARRDGM